MTFSTKVLNFVDGVSSSKVCGAHVRDRLTGKEWDIKAKSVVNATGPFTDMVRGMGNENKKICQPSSGTHIVLPEYYWYGIFDFHIFYFAYLIFSKLAHSFFHKFMIDLFVFSYLKVMLLKRPETLSTHRRKDFYFIFLPNQNLNFVPFSSRFFKKKKKKVYW